MKKFLTKRRVVVSSLVLVFLSAAIGAGFLLAEDRRLDSEQEEAVAELDAKAGTYDERTIVLNKTSKSEAKALAEKIRAKLRITDDGSFATLKLPAGTTIRDVYASRVNRAYLERLSPDYYTDISEIEDNNSRLPQKPDYPLHDSLSVNQTYLNYLNFGTAWQKTKGSGITVAVIDTGIDTGHPEFAGRLSEFSYNGTYDKIVKDYQGTDGTYDWSLVQDEQGHGTAVAGVIAAAMDGNGVVGIAPEVTILAIKAECDNNGGFYNTSDLVFGLFYAIERDVDVVNMSFGS